MEDAEPQPQAVAGGAPPPPPSGLVKLPPFWTEDPVSWFHLAEGQFALRNAADPVASYYRVLSSLSQDAVRLVRHVLHEDTGALGDMKPSVMLAEMLEYCPARESTTAVFAYLFFNAYRGRFACYSPRMTRPTCGQLRTRQTASLRCTFRRATSPLPPSPAARTRIRASGWQQRRWRGGRSSSCRPPQRSQQQKGQGRRQDAPRCPQSQLGGLRTSMCFYHAKFGERAKYCEEGCLWPEN
jgi:hypothetical protein